LLFDPVDLDSGFSNICKISSSVILWSDFKLPKSGVGGAASLVMPFLVMANRFVSQTPNVPMLMVQPMPYRWW
jgi:hypothetical protein